MPAPIKTASALSLDELEVEINKQAKLLIDGSKQFDEVKLKHYINIANTRIRKCVSQLTAMRQSPQRFDAADVKGLLDGLTPIANEK